MDNRHSEATHQQAIGALLAEVELALQASQARHQEAKQCNDADAEELEAEWQANLVCVQDQLEILRELWPDLIGAPRRGKTAPVAEQVPCPPGHSASSRSTVSSGLVCVVVGGLFLCLSITLAGAVIVWLLIK